MDNIVGSLMAFAALLAIVTVIGLVWEFGRRAWYWLGAKTMGWDEHEKFMRETAWIDRAARRDLRKQKLDEGLSVNYDRRRTGVFLATLAFASVGYNIDWPWWQGLAAVMVLWTGLHMAAGISMRWWY